MLIIFFENCSEAKANSYYCSVNDIFDNNNINDIITYTYNTKRFLLAEDTDDTEVT